MRRPYGRRDPCGSQTRRHGDARGHSDVRIVGTVELRGNRAASPPRRVAVSATRRVAAVEDRLSERLFTVLETLLHFL